MSFAKQSKFISLGIGIVVLALALILYFQALISPGNTLISIGNLSLEDLLSWNTEQLFILAWEAFWISFGLIIVYKLYKYSKERQGEALIHKLEGFEKWWIFTAVVGLTVLALITIPIAAPYLYGPDNLGINSNLTDAEVQNIDIVAQQFGFGITYVDGVGNSTHKLDKDQFIRFKLTTIDVTHGFGLYNEEGDLIIQAQIVPDYTTHITMKLQAGTYSIKCMEYCGYSHHNMEAINAINVE